MLECGLSQLMQQCARCVLWLDSVYSSDGRQTEETGDEAPFTGSFKQQLNFLLTSRERLQLRKALQIYHEKLFVYALYLLQTS